MRIAYFRRIVKVGNSYCVAVPKDVRMIIGASTGDYVRIEISKVEMVEDGANLHVNDAARSSPQTRDNGIHKEE